MDALLALILSCSFHHDDALVRAFIQKVSDGNSYFVGDLATVTSHDHAKNLSEALALVAEIEKHGGRPAVGLMAVPLEWAARYGRQPADLFDGCVNIAIGTDAMATFAADCLARATRHLARAPRGARPARPARRDCILRRFDVELGVRGYPQGVLSELARLSVRHDKRAGDSQRSRSQVGPDETDQPGFGNEDDWSDRRLYLAPSTLPSGARPR